MSKKVTLSKLFMLCFLFISPVVLTAQNVFINEIHYDNDSTDANEAIEIAGEAGTDLTGWSLVLYNGNNGTEYDTYTFSETITDAGNGFGFITVPFSAIQNGTPDGMALVNASAEVVQFLSYEGTFTASEGPANGLTSEDIGVSEPSDSPVGYSLQLQGEGTIYSDFTWAGASASTYGAINNNQIFGIPVANVFINEIHYDNASTDVDETIEIAGEAGTDLTGWSLVLYNGSNGTEYATYNFSETIADSGNGFGFIAVPFSLIQNGSPDGMALVNASGEVVQFLSYEGTFTASEGPANGLTSEDIGVSEPSDSPVGFSLQLEGEGTRYSDFTWAGASASTYGAVNNNQLIGQPVPVVFINEFHYDNDSTDENEAIELAGIAGTDLAGWSLVLYNGSNGEVYNTTTLSGVLNNDANGYGFVSVAISSIQNGPDGLALVNSSAEVIQFLSYEGSFTAVGGPADGLTSEDIGISESSSTPLGNSLQLTGTGLKYEDFSWAEIPNTFGAVNTGQVFSNVTDPGDLELISIANARVQPQGTRVKIKGILTASDQLGGPAFIEDATGGIPVFDETVHGTGLFQIGDELEIVGSLTQFRQMIQLGTVETVTKLSEGNTVTPTAATISELAALEGQLVFVDSIAFDIPGRLSIGNHSVSDATGSVEIRIDNNVESLIGRVKPDTLTTLTGVVGSFEGDLQIFPRFEADLPGTEEFVLQPPAGEDIPRDETFDIATWNMEFFGTTISGYGPTDKELQKVNALRVIDSLKADIIAVQEVSDADFLMAALAAHTTTEYGLVCSDVYSYSFEPDDGTFPPQKLCFIYNKATVSISDEKVLFEDFYTAARTGMINDLDDYPTGSAQSFWSSGRLPYMVTAQVNIMGVAETVTLVNVHAKSGAATEDVARKTYDFAVLKDTLDAYYGTEKLILLGDYNDDVDISIGGGTTPLQPFVSDTSNYNIVSKSFSYDGQNSTVGNSDVIDHTTITNELYDPYIEDSEWIINPSDFIENYGNTTSDHYPSVTRFLFEAPVEPLKVSLTDSITLYRGYSARATTVIKVEIEGGIAPYTVEWSNGDTGPETQVNPDDEGELLVTVTDDSGLNTITKTVYVNVVDVSCKKGRFNGVQMCYKGKSRCMPEFLVEHLLTKGYVLGDCEDGSCTDKKYVKARNNPFYGNLNLEFNFSCPTTVNIAVINYYGKTVHNTQLDVSEGTSWHTLHLSRLWRGFYIVKITDKNEPGYFKILKVFKK
ncbi:T9SS type A sorting domain-containing protein [Abyssalbus ytuae]|uniref:T9SS type A sorting domain-containing protein n=1 Tax=Abyssalbus ytuae TaxID=2926907 RepID=A0A9E6ZQF6_9FLAO|nr:T9SS type A sorting domain-containing protein [Abyssalbus ytuae]UOB18675.1 T9SS type A sorting domain-containing protein [Abyssalbus ytuae]